MESDVCKIIGKIEQFDRMQKMSFKLHLQGIENRDPWQKKIPFISWPPEWEVQFYPSYDALLRGVVRLKSNIERMVSFYLDGYAVLGFAVDHSNDMKPVPYWEIFNISTDLQGLDDPERYFMNEIDELLNGIKMMLEKS